MARWTVSSLALGLNILLVFFTSNVTAASYPVQQYKWYRNYYPLPEQYCIYGCQGTLNYVKFNFTPISTDINGYLLNRCSNKLLLNSILYCGQKYCTPREVREGRKALARDCDQIGLPYPTIEDARLSDEALNNILVLNYTAGLATANAPLGPGVAAIPDLDWHTRSERTVDAQYFNYDLSFDFSFALIGFWGLVIVVGMVYRILVYMGKPVDGCSSSSWWLWVRRTLILPATFGQKQAEAVAHAFTIPPRLETLLLTLYLVINIVMCFPSYDIFTGNLYYPEKRVQLARYIGDRTGFLSFAQLPMVWVFSARNEPFMWLTGWSYATFNRFHRWIARISVLHAVVHSIAYSFYAAWTSTYVSSWKEVYWWAGGIATIVMCLMLPASSYVFRQRCYELFLAVHILAALLSLITLWYHVRIFNGQFNYFLYPCIGIWALDRLLRIVRTTALSVMPRFAKGAKATVTYNHSTDLIRMDISEFLPKTDIVPGRYYYLYIPGNIRGWESHPFTLCSWRRPASSPSASPRTSAADKQIHASVRKSPDDYHYCSTAHTLLIRPHQGMTRRLERKLSLAPENIVSSRETVFLEGPYGVPVDLSTYSDILILCGGSGIAAAISHTHHIITANSTSRIHIAWASPRRDLPDDVCANELAEVIHTDRVHMTVYLTASAVADKDEDQQLPYETLHGRPNFEAIIRHRRSLATSSLAVDSGTRQRLISRPGRPLSFIRSQTKHVVHRCWLLAWPTFFNGRSAHIEKVILCYPKQQCYALFTQEEKSGIGTNLRHYNHIARITPASATRNALYRSPQYIANAIVKSATIFRLHNQSL
ncbi:unnamed protein product [Zymoseptoria tritici ST99CH_3D1]|uniref:FAD-binding FR-type domain-containing protein n=1 Tax=Zymoseptoria tritici ST99CH_1E4 TaxID=1276532 RepID=A0A2H1FNK4_ZYMTR|nr:unnamed protein product [Zymoseptoria tritici ST99CH_1E4]SMR45007.1 unnamed protein product [Zymoseptoria tritici ST99CH_3D1]